MLVVIGDWNVKIGNMKEENVIGLYGLKKNQKKQEINLPISGITCLHWCLFTWMPLEGVHTNQTDYIIAKRKCSIIVWKTWLGAECGTNLILYKFQVNVKKKANQFPWYELENISTIFKEYIRNHSEICNSLIKNHRNCGMNKEGWLWKETAQNKERKESKVDVRTNHGNCWEEKKREVKAKKDRNFRKEFNEEFQRAIRRQKQYCNNICKDIEDGNT